MNNELNLLQICIYAIIALLAGIMKELHRLTDNKYKFSIARLIANGAVSSFVGITTYFLLQNFEVNDYFTAFCTSIAGWIGGNLMDFFGVIFKKFVGKKLDVDVTDDDVKRTESKDEDKQ